MTYDGGNPAVIATVAGEADATTQLASEQAEMVRADRPLQIEGYGEVPPITDFIEGDLPVLTTGFGIFVPKEGTPPEVIETLDRIWDEVIPESEALKRYTLDRGALFTPAHGDQARRRSGRRSRATPGASTKRPHGHVARGARHQQTGELTAGAPPYAPRRDGQWGAFEVACGARAR